MQYRLVRQQRTGPSCSRASVMEAHPPTGEWSGDVRNLKAHLLFLANGCSIWEAVYPTLDDALPEELPAPGRLAEDAVRQLVQSVSAELDAVAPAAAAAVEQARAALESALKFWPADELAIRATHASLIADIAQAEASKRSALEAELVRLDAAMELVQARCGRVRAALTTLDPARLATLHPRMAASLTDTFAPLRETLPCGPEVEATIELIPALQASPPLLFSPELLGTLRTQRVRADALVVALPVAAEGGAQLHVAAGGVVEFDMRVPSDKAAADPLAVATVARCAQVIVRLVPPFDAARASPAGAGAISMGLRLRATLRSCADNSVTVTVLVPASTPTGAVVRLEQASLGGAAVLRGIPAEVLVAPSAAIAGGIARGMAPGTVSAWIPRVLDALLLKHKRHTQAPALSDDGRLFVPQGLSVAAYSLEPGAEGTLLHAPPLSVDDEALASYDRSQGCREENIGGYGTVRAVKWPQRAASIDTLLAPSSMLLHSTRHLGCCWSATRTASTATSAHCMPVCKSVAGVCKDARIAPRPSSQTRATCYGSAESAATASLSPPCPIMASHLLPGGMAAAMARSRLAG